MIRFRITLLILALLVSTGCVKRVATKSAPKSTPVIATRVNNVEMVIIPGGTFNMGNAKGKDDESVEHEVTVDSFIIDKFEATQGMLAKFEYPNPSQFKGDRRPVDQIRWVEAALFCNERSLADNLTPCYDEATLECDFSASGYRLPTEAEWEYAARAGTQEDLPGPDGNFDDLNSVACYATNSEVRTDPVGTRRANAWGLHDMLGNVAEWCNDVYSPDYYSNSPAANPTGPKEGPLRVLRGGSWNSGQTDCRITARGHDRSGISDACLARNTNGFRCVRKLSDEELKALNESSAD